MYRLIKPFIIPLAIISLEIGVGMNNWTSPLVSGVLIGIFVFWIIMAALSHKPLLRRFPSLIEWMPFLDPTGGFAGANQLTGKFIQGQTFNILAVQNDGVIRGRHFEDCDIYGPAVIAISHFTTIRACTFDHLASFILITQNEIRGPIVTEDCTFKRFHRIGFIGQKQVIDMLHAGTAQPKP